MYKIKRIEKLKKKGIYKIHFDHFDDVTLHEDVILSHGVLLKNELTEFEINDLKSANMFSSAYYQSIKFISTKLRSKHELRKYLTKEEYFPEVANEVIEKLENQGYINDKVYAKSFANTVLRTTNKGIDYIRKTLSEHQIGNEIVEEVISGLDYQEEYDKLYKLVSKRVQSNKKYSKKVLREKLFYDFKTKGFETDLINEVFNEIDFTLPTNKLEKEVSKLMRKHNDKYKVKQLLMKKGFSSEQIENAMRDEGLDGFY